MRLSKTILNTKSHRKPSIRIPKKNGDLVFKKMHESIQRDAKNLANVLESMAKSNSQIIAAAIEIEKCIIIGGKVLTAGNGGSAADALHLAEELVGKFSKPRKSLPAVCLSADSTLITCIGNDFGFENIFSRQIEGLADPRDIFIAFSTSGNSKNILRALLAANSKSVKSVLMTGNECGCCQGRSDIEIRVPSNETARIQEAHTFILHSWLKYLEREY
jgi:phosphoheptose isomerase